MLSGHMHLLGQLHLTLNLTYPLTKYLLHAYYLPGTVLMLGLAVNNSQKRVPSWDCDLVLHCPVWSSHVKVHPVKCG